MGENKSMLGRILTWTIIGVLAVVVFKVALRVLGLVMGIVGFTFGALMFLIFTVGPVVLLGWLAVKAWKMFVKEPETEL